MVATAGAMVAAVQVAAGTDPAAAGCIWVGSDCIEEVVVTAPPYDPGPGGQDDPGSSNDPGQADATGLYRDKGVAADLLPAFVAADEALAGSLECEALVMGPQRPYILKLDGVKQYVGLDYVLRRAANTLTDDPSSPMVPSETSPRRLYAKATNKYGGQYGGLGEDLTLYAWFHTIQHDPVFYPGLQLNGATPQPYLVQAMVLIHEVAHMTGALPPHVGGDYGADFNRQIMDKCLGF